MPKLSKTSRTAAKPLLQVVVKFFYPVAAGIETNIMETHVTLSKYWQVVIHATRNSLTERNIYSEHEVIKGLEVRRYPWQTFTYWPKLETTPGSLICLHNFNIFPHGPLMAWAWWLKMTGRKKFGLFLTPHGGFTPEWSNFSPLSRLVKWSYHRTIGAFLINVSVDGVRAVSDWEAAEMSKTGINPKLITVISNGIEDLAFQPIAKKVSATYKKRIKDLGPYLIQMGRIHQIKNFETTIKALPLLPKNVKFVIAGPVGDAVYKQKLEALITELNLTDRVIFWGVTREAEKFYLINQAQMMVHMAMWESYCNVVHEGMSQGLVCIVANNTALPFLIKNNINGFCLPTFDHLTLARKINWVLKNKHNNKVKKIENHNRQIVKSHSWKRVAEKMNVWYQQTHQKFV
jgi:glycosyltransferase involved in cell wall biosynthesis